MPRAQVCVRLVWITLYNWESLPDNDVPYVAGLMPFAFVFPFLPLVSCPFSITGFILLAMLIDQGNDPPASLGGGQHKGCSLVIDHASGFASHIVRELCHAVQHLLPKTRRSKTRGLVFDLAVGSKEICQKRFEVKFSRPIEVVSAASFGELHRIYNPPSPV